ncbi:hypothetical protein SAMD00023353_3600930 [Rosellinia necatrix]|uniref:Uncharacterized protein n=1 Tax=Rosellinia necatrix TaxID=77044 RepID=A0A1S8A914_ROSNE|nr:hypothetical protein SAMD00023353_3600930 [Rosellinia necatrix]
MRTVDVDVHAGERAILLRKGTLHSLPSVLDFPRRVFFPHVAQSAERVRSK